MTKSILRCPDYDQSFILQVLDWGGSREMGASYSRKLLLSEQRYCTLLYLLLYLLL